MKKTLLLWCICSLLLGTTSIQAQNYLKPGVRWTEIQLDTLLHDSWYSQVETEEGIAYVPNFEVVEYRILSEGTNDIEDHWALHDVVSDNGLVCFLCSDAEEGRDEKSTLFTHWDNVRNEEKQDSYVFSPSSTYYWNAWQIGQTASYVPLPTSQLTGGYFPLPTYGVITGTGEDFFGGTKPLKYADTDKGLRIIQGIGVTAWNDKECIVGPAEVYKCIADFAGGEEYNKTLAEHHHRSMLVRFEDSNGQVLYNMWPNEKGQLEQGIPQTLASQKSTGIYDLQGRKLQRRPAKGLFIEDGKLKTR